MVLLVWTHLSLQPSAHYNYKTRNDIKDNRRRNVKGVKRKMNFLGPLGPEGSGSVPYV